MRVYAVPAASKPLDGIYVVGTDGKAPTRLPTAPSIPDGYPSWFPDGSAVTGEGSNPPFIVLVGVPDGTLLQTETSIAQLWTGQSAISREGTQLAFAAQVPQAGSQYDDDHNQIWIQRLIPANTNPAQFDTDLHQLDPLQGRTPDWSPNDSFLTFESRRGCLNGNYAIFIESALTGEALQGEPAASLTPTMRYGHRTAGALHFPPNFSYPRRFVRQDAAVLQLRRCLRKSEN